MFSLVDPETAVGQAAELLGETRRQLGRVPNLYRAMANSPKALAAYLAFRGALQDGTLDIAMTERIAMQVAQLNDCDYCVAAHFFRGQKIGLSLDELNKVRVGRHDNPKIHAAMSFIAALVKSRGALDDVSRADIFAHGWTEFEVGEIVAHVALNVFSNYFKHVAQPTLDFPQAPMLAA